MANARNWLIATPELSDLAEMSASTSGSETPITNLQKIQPTDVWAATTTGAWLTMDMGSAVTMNLFLALFSNAVESSVWRVRTATSEANLTASPTFDTGAALSIGSAALTAASKTDPAYPSASWLFEVRFRLRSDPAGSRGIVRLASASAAGMIDIFTSASDRVLVDPNSLGVITMSSELDNHVWVTVSLSYSSGTLLCYLDGVLVATRSHNFSSLNFNEIILAPGTEAEADLRFVRLWNSTRTDEDILEDHDKQLTSSVTGLLANYRFNESLANSGTLGSSLGSVSGTAVYRHAMPFWASRGLDSYTRTHGMLWMPDSGIKGSGGVESSVSNRWVRFDLDFTGADGNVAKLGRVYASNAMQPERNPTYGADLWSFHDNAASEIMAGGQRVVTPSGSVPGFRLPFQWDSAEDMAEFYEIVRARGASRDVAVILDPIDHDGRRHQRIGYGTLSQRITANVPSYGVYRSEVDLNGLI